MKSSIPRGTYEEYVTNFENVDISAVSWKDNKQQPAETIKRYDKKMKRKLEIPCLKVIKEYNAHMGGVDLMDSHLGRYRIRIKSRKWYMRIFYHLLDLTIINAWILYRTVMGKRGKASKDIMNLADFRSELADTLCKYFAPIPRGRPRSLRQLQKLARLPRYGKESPVKFYPH